MKTYRQLIDEAARVFPMMTARLRSQKHDAIAKKDWEAHGKDRTLNTDRHIRASDRYARIASGKHPFKKIRESLDEAMKDGDMHKGFEALHKVAGKQPTQSGSTEHRTHAQYNYKDTAEAKEHMAKIHAHLSSVHKHLLSSGSDTFHQYKSSHTTGHVVAKRDGKRILVLHDHHNMSMNK